MLRNNSPTLQGMINNVGPGVGNFNTGSPTAAQFQSPYPSPKDMVMSAGAAAFQQYGNPMYLNSFQAPGQSINMTMPQPMEHVQNFVSVPGAPVNPDLAHMAGQSIQMPTNPTGRFMNVQNPVPNYGRNFVGGIQQQTPSQIAPYASFIKNGELTLPTLPSQMNFPQHYGYLDVYDGEVVHPDVYHGWYGSDQYPFYRESDQANRYQAYQNNLRNAFMERFPGYSNPYMGYGFMQPVQQPAINPDIQRNMNLAAYYGFSYEEFIQNSSEMYKLMCRISSTYLGQNEEINRRKENRFDVKKCFGTLNQDPNDVDDDGLFYPPGAFDGRGNLTRYYQGLFCVNRKRVDENKKKLREATVLMHNGVEVPTRKKPIDFINSREKMDQWFINDQRYKYYKAMADYRSAIMYLNAPERQVDHCDGNVFTVFAKSLNYTYQKELELRWAYSRATQSTLTFNKDAFMEGIRKVRDENRKRRREENDRKFMDLVQKVGGAGLDLEKAKEEANHYRTRPYIEDGDWIIAKPGVDIVGMPLEQSVNKIVKMNMVTGEEEIYNPDKPMGLDIREQIKASMEHPTFNDMDDEELARRLELFKNASFETNEV